MFQWQQSELKDVPYFAQQRMDQEICMAYDDKLMMTMMITK